MQERFSEKKNLLEFLKILGNIERQTKVSNIQVAELKSDLQKKIIGKHVILLYVGQIAVKRMAKIGEYVLQIWLDYIRESFEQVRDAYVIWYDDGLIDSVYKWLKQEDELDCRVDTQNLSKIYEKEKKKYIDCPWTGYMKSFPMETLAELADVVYGDKGVLSDIMMAHGKLFVEADWFSLCDTPQSQTMEEWFKKILAVDNQDIPVEWRGRVQGKKVILYYLTAESFLHYGMAAVGKLEHVVSQLSMEKEFKLWYLEDPRIDELLPCISEDISEKYLKLRDSIRCGAGIFDDSGNAWRAISKADAYYGDWIEEIKLLHRRGKPGLLQDIPGTVENTGKTRQSPPLWPSTACRVGDSIWFVHGKLALLCKYFIKTQRMELVERIPGKIFLRESLYIGICYYQGKIFLLPSWADGRVVVYYICERKFKFLQIPDEEKKRGSFFIETFVYGKYLFALPQFYRYVLRIDMDNLEIQMAGDLLGRAQSITPKAQYMNSVVKVNDHVVAGVFTNTNLVMLYDVVTEEMQMRRVGGDNASYTSLTCMHDDLFLCDYAGKMLVRYSVPAQKIIATYSVPLDNYIMHNLPNEIIMLDGVQDGKCCTIDWEGKITSIEQRRTPEKKNPLYYAYTCGVSFSDGSDLWYFNRCDYRVYCYHKNGDTDIFELPWSEVDELFYNRQTIKMISQECDKELPGGNFILQIKELMSKIKEKDSISNVGEKVYRCIK